MNAKVSQVVFILSASIAIGITLGQGCAKSFYKSPSSGTTNNSSTSANIEATTLDPNVATLGVIYNKQVLDHFVSCSGLGVASDETQATWSSKKGAISIDGTVTSITAPMLMAVTTIAGDVCRDIISQEKQNPRLFPGVNWAAAALPSDATLGDSIRGLALSCWQRPEDDQEKQILFDSIKSQFTGASVTPDDVYLFLCTTMLSSLDTLTL